MHFDILNRLGVVNKCDGGQTDGRTVVPLLATVRSNDQRW